MTLKLSMYSIDIRRIYRFLEQACPELKIYSCYRVKVIQTWFCDSVFKENVMSASLVKHFPIVRLNLRLCIGKVIHCKIQLM